MSENLPPKESITQQVDLHNILQNVHLEVDIDLNSVQEFEFMFDTSKTKELYFKLAKKILSTAKYTSSSVRVVATDIRNLEEKLHLRLAERYLDEHGITSFNYKLYLFLQHFELLSLLPQPVLIQMQRIDTQMTQRVSEISQEFSLSADEIHNILLEIFSSGTVKSLSEAADVMGGKMRIEGFSNGEDPAIEESILMDFVKENTSRSMIIEIKVGKLEKSADFFVILPTNEARAIAEVFFKEFPEKGEMYSGNSCLLHSGEAYKELMKVLNGEDEKDTYKNLAFAHAGFPGRWSSLEFFNFGVAEGFFAEYSEELDYLVELNLPLEAAYTAYVLGLVTHELTHRLPLLSDPPMLEEYSLILKTSVEKDQGSHAGYVSDYVHSYTRDFEYEPTDFTVISEDLSDSAQIYVINPDYLQKHYSERHAFIKKNLAHLNEGSAIKK